MHTFGLPTRHLAAATLVAIGCTPAPPTYMPPTPPAQRAQGASVPDQVVPAATRRVVPYVPPRIAIPEEPKETWFEPSFPDVGGSAKACRLCRASGLIWTMCPQCVGRGYLVETMGRSGSVEHSSGPKCKRCDGLGEVQTRCHDCGGSGMIVTRG